jgi:hypothetical protein
VQRLNSQVDRAICEKKRAVSLTPCNKQLVLFVTEGSDLPLAFETSLYTFLSHTV